MKKVTAIGGGTGLSTLLRGIRDYPLSISAIVTMTDNGASTGRLRKDMDVLPPGDIRKCIAALSKEEGALLPLFEYRFKRGFGLSGHSFGNLLITALIDITGSFEEAVYLASRILQTQGDIFPSTLDNAHLVAKFKDGKKVTGEEQIIRYGYKHKIQKIGLDTKAKASPKAVKEIEDADVLVVGPGSLYTSLLPNFLLPGIKKAYTESQALKVYVANVSTERGETEGYKLSHHLDELTKYGLSFDVIIANEGDISKMAQDKYLNAVENDVVSFDGAAIIKEKIYNQQNPLYHDSEKLGDVIYNIATNIKKYRK